jgi:hypothetical protein
MFKDRLLAVVAVLVSLVMCAGAVLAQQTNSSPTARLVVTIEPKRGNTVPVINQNEVMVYEGRDRDRVVDWVPAQGDHAALQIFILIDDSSSASLGSQLQDIKQFINAQAPTTQFGVAYMQNGIARVVQDLSTDHEAAAKSLRLPMGEAGANASPYFSLSDLIKKWPDTEARREVLMVTDGIDRYYGTGDVEDPYLLAAIDDAGKKGIQVSAIYNPGEGHFGHSYWQTYWGQIYLSRLADETGGEAYYIGMTGAPVAFAPFLEQFGHRLDHQYLLTFIPKPQKKAGWQNVRLRTELPNVDLISAHKVYVPATE